MVFMGQQATVLCTGEASARGRPGVLGRDANGGDVAENLHLSLPGDQSLSFALEDTGAHGRI